jgi:hypothetical protein
MATLFAVSPGQKLLGEIVTWTAGGITLRHIDLIDALRANGLEESVARELAPRHAFARACKRLSEARIIRQVSEDEKAITFQFTKEQREADRFEYALETMLFLDKASGHVSCDLPGLAARAQEELDRCIVARTGGDVTRVVQKLFERQADLFPIRPQGGAYFLPQEHVSFANRVEAFLRRVNGRMARYPIPAGTPHGDRSVKESVAAGIATLIADHEAAIDGFGEDTRPDTLTRAAERIKLTKHKIACYACYLAEERSRLERQLAESSSRLVAKVEKLAELRDGVPVATGA